MLFTTYEKAREVKRRLGEGELFEDIAIHEDESGNALSSGFLGRFDPSEVHPEIAKALLAREMLGEPAIVQTESGFHIVQRITPFDPGSWETLVTNKTVPRSEPRQFVKAGKKEEGNESPRKHNRQQKGRFIVHAGSFKDKHNATERDNSLRTLGYESYLVTKQSKANGVFYHVIAGKYDDMRDARSAGQAIASHGFDYFIFSEKKD